MLHHQIIKVINLHLINLSHPHLNKTIQYLNNYPNSVTNKKSLITANQIHKTIHKSKLTSTHKSTLFPVNLLFKNNAFPTNLIKHIPNNKIMDHNILKHNK